MIMMVISQAMLAQNVNYCRNNNVEVWALFSNLENPDVDTEAVLTHTSSKTTFSKTDYFRSNPI